MRILSQLGFGIKLGGSRVMAQATCINVERAVMLQGVMGIVRGPNHFHHPPIPPTMVLTLTLALVSASTTGAEWLKALETLCVHCEHTRTRLLRLLSLDRQWIPTQSDCTSAAWRVISKMQNARGLDKVSPPPPLRLCTCTFHRRRIDAGILLSARAFVSKTKVYNISLCFLHAHYASGDDASQPVRAIAVSIMIRILRKLATPNTYCRVRG